jgi:regulatory protein
VAFPSRPPAPPSSDAPPVDPVERARQVCLHQLEHAPRTRAELANVLRRKGIDDDVAEQVLSRFAEVGMIDDALFAQLWVTSRHRGKGLAGRALSQELRRKGVADETAAAAVAGLDPERELATARALVDRRLRTTAGLPTDARVRRLAGMLARKGYPAGTAFRVVREALAAEGEDAELAFDELQSLEE